MYAKSRIVSGVILAVLCVLVLTTWMRLRMPGLAGPKVRPPILEEGSRGATEVLAADEEPSVERSFRAQDSEVAHDPEALQARQVPWEEARDGLRTMAAELTEADARELTEHVVGWGRGFPKYFGHAPDFLHPTLNPLRKEIGPTSREELLGIVEGYQRLLEELAVDAEVMLEDALGDYFDRGLHERFSGDVFPEAPIVQKGRYTRNSTIGLWGWTVRTRFSSSLYPDLEALLENAETLRRERLEAVTAYISALAAVPAGGAGPTSQEDHSQ